MSKFYRSLLVLSLAFFVLGGCSKDDRDFALDLYVTVEDGTWGLVRASSNKPGLVVVVESPTSEENMRAIFTEIDTLLSSYEEVGEYDQKI